MRAFIRRNTALARPPLVPEIELHLATEITPIWHATEEWLEQRNLPPPFWAFAWPGSQVLARHVLDHPELVLERRVLDFAAGNGLAAIACAMAGAAHAEAAEIDAVASESVALNAGHNGVAVRATTGDVVGTTCRWDVILCGDICYEAPMTRHVLPWLRTMARNALVLVADPGRAYLPTEGMEEMVRMDVPTSLELEDRTVRTTRLLRLLPPQ